MDKIIRLSQARYCIECEIVWQAFDICPLCGTTLVYPLNLWVPTLEEVREEESVTKQAERRVNMARIFLDFLRGNKIREDSHGNNGRNDRDD